MGHIDCSKYVDCSHPAVESCSCWPGEVVTCRPLRTGSSEPLVWRRPLNDCSCVDIAKNKNK